MRRKLAPVASLIFITSFLLTASSAAASQGGRFGPFATSSTDIGSCGNAWALDSYDLFFNVHRNSDGSFSVQEQFKNASFVTFLGPSPGACASDPNHGIGLLPGMRGTFTGDIDFIVTGGAYTPAGCDAAPAVCKTAAGFISVTFPGGTRGCGPKGCTFAFEYAAGAQGLAHHHWADVSAKGGGDLFRGDIANF